MARTTKPKCIVCGGSIKETAFRGACWNCYRDPSKRPTATPSVDKQSKGQTVTTKTTGGDKHLGASIDAQSKKKPKNAHRIVSITDDDVLPLSRLSQGRKPKHSTPFEPGTKEKMKVMQSRASRGESCFHPDDAKLGTADLYKRMHQNKEGLGHDGDDE